MVNIIYQQDELILFLPIRHTSCHKKETSVGVPFTIQSTGKTKSTNVEEVELHD